MKLRHLNTFLQFRLLFHKPHCSKIHIFSCGHATLYEALSVCPSVGPSIRQFVNMSRKLRKQAFLMLFDHVSGGFGVWMGVGCPCPPVRYDIVTPGHLFFNFQLNCQYFEWKYYRNIAQNPICCDVFTAAGFTTESFLFLLFNI